MWRESIGTSIGIVQARRMGIPVILIDPHYIDSPLLKSIVGDFIVHDETAAIRMLKKDVLPLLGPRNHRQEAGRNRRCLQSQEASKFPKGSLPSSWDR